MVKQKKKNLILYILIGAWLFFSGALLYIFWPIIYPEIAYFLRPGNNQEAPRVEKEDVGGVLKYNVPNKVVIPKINVDVPLVLAPGYEDKDILKALESGIAHYPNTALPGEVGNVFVTGHSSNYPWAQGAYNYAFSLLNKLDNGDMVYVYYQGEKYTYKVFEVKIVSPSDTSVLSKTNNSIISLMTCDPPGTTWKRRIVKAEQIEPDPKNNKVIDFELILPENLVGN